ncbi:MAG: NADPH:quinone oxidoreductase family protein [Acidisphaera sp.]|nr:NADPH:quinone oxidoreductase family protein [Acidisphaera sp.]
MKAWVVERITEAGEMRLADLPVPEPGPGQYVVQMEAAGLNFLDALMLRGAYQVKPALPFVPGVEIAGAIIAAGPDTELKPGERVFAAIPQGGFAACALIGADAAFPIPEDLPGPEAIALLGVNYPTSWYALNTRAQLRAGETVLVHAGAGGVGSAAVQLALAAGARVIATAGGAEKVAACRALGAELAIDYTAEDWVRRVREHTDGLGVDVIFDPVGDAVGEGSLRCLAWMGRYLVIGFAGGRIPGLAANRLLLRNAAALGVFWNEVRERDPEMVQDVQYELLALYRRRAVEPLIPGRYRLEEADRAVQALAGRGTIGKVVLVAE